VLIPDLNVLLYATNSSTPQHAPCAAFLNDALSGPEPVGFPWVVLLGFVRLSTKATIFVRPLEVTTAFDVIDAWLSRPAALTLHPTEAHQRTLRDLLVSTGTAGNLTTDAHLAALALEHGATLVSCDRDFGRFRALKHVNPLDP
jgi:toxin-antitoxin system PIN domain toxin